MHKRKLIDKTTTRMLRLTTAAQRIKFFYLAIHETVYIGYDKSLGKTVSFKRTAPCTKEQSC